MDQKNYIFGYKGQTFGNIYSDDIIIKTVSKNGESIGIDNYEATSTLGKNISNSISISSESENNIAIGIRTIRGSQTLEGSNISITAKGTTNTNQSSTTSAIWLQNNTQDENIQNSSTLLTINAKNIEIKSNNIGIAAFSNSQAKITGNIQLSAKTIIDTRGNSVVKINDDGLHTSILNGDIAFETPYTPDDSQNSGDFINSNVSINLTGKTSSWTGRSYQQRGKNAAKTVAIDVDDAVYGKVTGFKATLADGGKWNVTGDSFINSLTLKNGGIVNASDAVKTLNIGDLTIEGTGNQLTLANAGAVNGTINFADGAGLTTALNTAYTINDADKLANGAVNNAAGRLTLGSVGTTGASLTISDAFTYTQAGLDAIASAYGAVTTNLDNASLYVDPAATNKEFNLKKGTISLIAR